MAQDQFDYFEIRSIGACFNPYVYVFLLFFFMQEHLNSRETFI